MFLRSQAVLNDLPSGGRGGAGGVEHSRLKCGTLLDSLFRIRRIILCTLVLHRVPFHHKESVVYARLSDIRNTTKI